MSQVVATFYKFVRLADYAAQREPLLNHCLAAGLKGTILLAAEGINGTIVGTEPAVTNLLAFLQRDPRLVNLAWRSAQTTSIPFDRMKVKLKPEIVTLGMPEVDPSQQVGVYVSPQDWNQLLADPEVTVIDVRNHFEVAIGSFETAVDPHTTAFRDFPQYVQTQLDPQKHQKVAMFCTGGIRCEKASAYLLQEGFQQVYQLQGGILNYLEQVPTAESQWQGECFVFDQRVAVIQDGQGSYQQGSYELCAICGYPIVSPDSAPSTELGEQEPAKPQRCPACCDRNSG